MKKITFFLAFLLFVSSSFSQQQTPSKDYLKKSKNKKDAALILLAAGTTMAVVGAISFNHNWSGGSDAATDFAGLVMIGGVVCDIISIPFFISSSKNKRRAASIAINNQNIFSPAQNSLAWKTRPAVTLKLGLSYP